MPIKLANCYKSYSIKYPEISDVFLTKGLQLKCDAFTLAERIETRVTLQLNHRKFFHTI
jgi:hypothetical protein